MAERTQAVSVAVRLKPFAGDPTHEVVPGTIDQLRQLVTDKDEAEATNYRYRKLRQSFSLPLAMTGAPRTCVLGIGAAAPVLQS
jgi:hypothetical protein